MTVRSDNVSPSKTGFFEIPGKKEMSGIQKHSYPSAPQYPIRIMSGKIWYRLGLPGILAIFLVWSMVAVSAQEVPDLTGAWEAISVDTYISSDGFLDQTSYQGPFQIMTQEGRAFAGEETYYDSETGENVTHFFPGVVSPDGKTYLKDETGSGISFGELVSEDELYNYMLFSEPGLMAIVSHMGKEGSVPAPEGQVPDVTGVWNLTHTRSSGVSTSGLLTINEQQGRIWSGQEQISDDDGTMIDLPIVGTVGESGRVYGVTQNGAFMFGSMTNDAAIESGLVIPGDTDGTLVIERWLTRNETPIPESESMYPDITGEWTIEDRKVIENGTITDEGPLSEEWMSYANMTGRFVTATRHSGEVKGSPEIESSVIFLSPDEAVLTNAQSALVMYHIIDNSTMEAVVNRKDGKSILNLDLLKRKAD